MQIVMLSAAAVFSAFTLTSLALGDVVFNGSDSLPHNAYFMYRAKPVIPHGAYVHFPAPDGVAAAYQDLSFVKRVVGRPGDVITTDDATVCIRGVCRDLLADMITRGAQPLASGPILEGHIAVFGDADNSLDSRYAAIGLIAVSDVSAVGFPIPLPHWTEVRTWATD